MLRWYLQSKRLFLAFCCYLLLVFVGLAQLQLGAPQSTDQLRFTVIIRHYGVDAAEMERSIGIPLENAVAALQGTARLRTQASMNENRLDIELLPGVSLNQFYLELREVCDRIYQGLPGSVQKPEIFYSSARDQFFYIVAIQNPHGSESLRELRQLVEYDLKPLISRVPGVGEIQVGGGEPREIHIEIDQNKLSAYQLSPFEVQAQLQSTYVRQGSGQIHSGSSHIPVIFDSRFANLEQLEAWPLTLKGRNGEVYRIPLGQLASVSYQSRETESISRINSQRSIVLYLKATGTSSIIETSKQVSDIIEQWLQTYTYEKQLVYNLGDDLSQQLRKLYYTTFLSTLIIILFIFFTYRNISQALVSGCFIVVSSLSALALFGYSGLPLNFESLSIVNISIGLVADVSILLNIAFQHKYKEKHKGLGNSRVSALKSVIKLFPALCYSTVTSVIVVIPLILQANQGNLRLIGTTFSLIIIAAACSNMLFLPGFLAVFSSQRSSKSEGKPQSITRAIACVPKILKMLPILPKKTGGRIAKPGAELAAEPRTKPGSIFSSAVLVSLFSLWRSFALYRRRKPLYVRIAALSLCAASLLLLAYLPRNNQTAQKGKQLFAYLGMPSGTHVDAVDQGLNALSEALRTLPGIEKVESRARRDSGTISVVFEPRQIARTALSAWLDRYSAQMPEGFVYATEGGAMELQAEISIIGPEHAKNRELARQVSSYLNDLSSNANRPGKLSRSRPWISHSVLNFQAPSPMIAYRLFPDRLQQYGLDSSTVSQKLRWALYGPVSLKWQASDNTEVQSEIDVRIMGIKEQYNSYEAIRRSGLLNNQRKYVYFKDIGSFKNTTYIKNLYRQNRQKSAYFTIYSPVLDAATVYNKLDEALKGFAWPENYSYHIDPELQKKTQKSRALLVSFALATILIYVILAIFYESLLLPLSVLLSIPLAVILPLAIFYFMGIGISEQVFIALIICTGIQVNNIIFIVDDYLAVFVRYFKGKISAFRHGSLVHVLAGEMALRNKQKHILLTSFSTIFGQLPLLWSGDAALKVFAITMISGLAGSILISFLLIPVCLMLPRLAVK